MALTSRPGPAAYHPALLVKLLLYGYCTGEVSSRNPEQATYEEVPYRVRSRKRRPRRPRRRPSPQGKRRERQPRPTRPVSSPAACREAPDVARALDLTGDRLDDRFPQGVGAGAHGSGQLRPHGAVRSAVVGDGRVGMRLPTHRHVKKSTPVNAAAVTAVALK